MSIITDRIREPARVAAGAGRSAGMALSIALLAAAAPLAAQTFDFGSPASAGDIAAIDIDVMPDGAGAPPGEGSYAEGKDVYMTQCAACHGQNASTPTPGTGAPALTGGRGTLDSGSPVKTVESYWPYASTLFDYTKRAMPFGAPGSLSDEQVYAVVAYILAEAGIIDQQMVMNAETIATVEMPNRDGFVPDPRPDVFNYR